MGWLSNSNIHCLLSTWKQDRSAVKRVGVLINDELALELKSVEDVKGIRKAQLLSYMKLAGVKAGLLINFNVKILRTGVKGFVL